MKYLGIEFLKFLPLYLWALGQCFEYQLSPSDELHNWLKFPRLTAEHVLKITNGLKLYLQDATQIENSNKNRKVRKTLSDPLMMKHLGGFLQLTRESLKFLKFKGNQRVRIKQNCDVLQTLILPF
jgi:hypothetical protein